MICDGEPTTTTTTTAAADQAFVVPAPAEERRLLRQPQPCAADMEGAAADRWQEATALRGHLPPVQTQYVLFSPVVNVVNDLSW